MKQNQRLRTGAVKSNCASEFHVSPFTGCARICIFVTFLRYFHLARDVDKCTVLSVGIALVHSKYCFPLKKRILICAYPLLAPLTRRETQNFGEEEKLSFFLKLCVYPHEAFLLRELSRYIVKLFPCRSKWAEAP